MLEQDEIQKIIGQWEKERPELDSSGFAAAGRILVLSEIMNRRLSKVLAPLDLTVWGFDVLATLRRQGASYRLTPTELSRATMLTTGAMTNRLDRLESAGLLVRESNPADRRGLRVRLTDKGKERVDAAVALRFQAANEELSVLTEKERKTFTALAAKLLGALTSETLR